jgi:GTP cyclohydrolase I
LYVYDTKTVSWDIADKRLWAIVRIGLKGEQAYFSAKCGHTVRGSRRMNRPEKVFPIAHIHYNDEIDNNGKVVVPDEVQEAIRTLIRWSGDDPSREGLLDTPARVGRAWREYCSGYADDPAAHLSRTFEEVGGYHELVLLKDIPFQSHCEHHMAPITGKASIAYMPTDRVVGISKLVRVLNGFSQRLQVQERLTAEVANCIWDNLKPHGVAVVIEATHGCMTGRGVKVHGSGMVTSKLIGCFLDDQSSRKEVMSLMGY